MFTATSYRAVLIFYLQIRQSIVLIMRYIWTHQRDINTNKRNPVHSTSTFQISLKPPQPFSSAPSAPPSPPSNPAAEGPHPPGTRAPVPPQSQSSAQSADRSHDRDRNHRTCGSSPGSPSERAEEPTKDDRAGRPGHERRPEGRGAVGS